MKAKVDRVEEWVRLYRPEIENEHESESGNDKTSSQASKLR